MGALEAGEEVSSAPGGVGWDVAAADRAELMDVEVEELQQQLERARCVRGIVSRAFCRVLWRSWGWLSNDGRAGTLESAAGSISAARGRVDCFDQRGARLVGKREQREADAGGGGDAGRDEPGEEYGNGRCKVQAA